MIDFSYSVERLVDVSNVVDDKAQSERTLVLLIGELFRDLGYVLRSCGVGIALEEGMQVSETVDDVHFGRSELREVLDSCTLFVQVGLVDEVPWGLEFAESSFDLVSKDSTLSERMIFFVVNQIRMTDSQIVQILKSRFHDFRALD